MRNPKRLIRLVLAVALVLGATALLLQPAAAGMGDTMSTTEWVRTPEAQSQDKQCSGGEECWELCERFGNQVVPLGHFQCR